MNFNVRFAEYVSRSSKNPLWAENAFANARELLPGLGQLRLGGVPRLFLETRNCGSDQFFLPQVFSFGSTQLPN